MDGTSPGLIIVCGLPGAGSDRLVERAAVIHVSSAEEMALFDEHFGLRT